LARFLAVHGRWNMEERTQVYGPDVFVASRTKRT
jgi:hypothetical protein